MKINSFLNISYPVLIILITDRNTKLDIYVQSLGKQGENPFNFILNTFLVAYTFSK